MNNKQILCNKLSTSARFALENTDIMFLSFALSTIIATLGISGYAARLILSIINLGMLVGGVIFGLIEIVLEGPHLFSYDLYFCL